MRNSLFRICYLPHMLSKPSKNCAKTEQTLGKNTYLGNMFLGFMVTKENFAKNKQTLGKNIYLGNMLTTIDAK